MKKLSMTKKKKIHTVFIIAFICLTMTAVEFITVTNASRETIGSQREAESSDALNVDSVEAKATPAYSNELRGLWVSFCDFKSLGFYDKSKTVYRKNIGKLFGTARKNGINTVYFHVRAFDDAVYKSSVFNASKYITSKASSKTARNTYSYDPLSIAVTEAHRRGIKLHAWMNPYRVTYNYFLDPAKAYSTKRIIKAIKEVKKYDIDGIHFDDYFYSAKKGYFYKTSDGKNVKHKVKISAADKRAYVNKMIKKAYTETHFKRSLKFGISPAGNYENCMMIGADVKTWLSKNGYLDYIVPQIYWTDNWGSRGKVMMFTNRLKNFKAKNKLKKPIYAGLALYRTGYRQTDDRGWGMRNTNIRAQVKKARILGINGYVLFTAADMNRKRCQKELYYLRRLVNPAQSR